LNSNQTMDRRTPSSGFLKHPRNKVIALLDDVDSVGRAISDLVRAGFERESIDVLSGAEGAVRLDLDGRHHGLRARLYRWVEGLSDIREWLERHSHHITRGGFGLAVSADKNRKAEAANILQEHGAHDGAFFGAAYWERLDMMDSNASRIPA
jgi:hypothetical protein